MPSPPDADNGKTVLITGASGFVGPHLAAFLAQCGFNIRAASRTPQTYVAGSRITWARLPDLGANPQWDQLLDGVDFIVHAAGIAHADTDLPESLYHQVNSDATESLCQAACKAGIERLVFLSSVRAQSGPVARQILTEQNDPQPTDAYGRSKLLAEQHIQAANLHGIILRPVLVYGPGVKGNMASLIKLARTPLPLPLAGLTARRSLLSITNLCSAIRFAMIDDQQPAGTYLVADEAPVTIPELITAMRLAINRPALLFPTPRRLTGMACAMIGKSAAWRRLNGELVVSTEKLRNSGWRPEQEFNDSIRAMMRG